MATDPRTSTGLVAVAVFACSSFESMRWLKDDASYVDGFIDGVAEGGEHFGDSAFAVRWPLVAFTEDDILSYVKREEIAAADKAYAKGPSDD